MAEDDSLRIGDLIYLSSTSGELFSADLLRGSFAQKKSASGEMPDSFVQDCLFRIGIKASFKAKAHYDEELRSLQEIKAKRRINDDSRLAAEEAGLSAQLVTLKEAAEEEKRKNEQLQDEKAGSLIFYGDHFQLEHFGSSSFLSGDEAQSAALEKSAFKLSLLSDPDKSCAFSLMPRFKIRSLGDRVFSGDQALLRHNKTGKLVHLSHRQFSSDSALEVNLSAGSTWQVNQFAQYSSEGKRAAQIGDVVRIFHAETESYLGANALTGKAGAQVFVEEPRIVGGLRDTLSSNTMFQIEPPRQSRGGGGLLLWDTRYRIKHFGTRRSITCPTPSATQQAEHSWLDENESLPQLAGDEEDDGAAGTGGEEDSSISFVAVDAGDLNVPYGALFRIQSGVSSLNFHVGSKTVAAIEDTLGGDASSDAESSQKSRRPVDTDLSSRRRPLVTSTQEYYEDVFYFQPVEASEIADLQYANNQLESLHDFGSLLSAYAKKEVSRPKRDQTRSVIQALENLIYFVIDDGGAHELALDTSAASQSGDDSDPDVGALSAHGVPRRKRQTLLYEQDVVDYLLGILQTPFEHVVGGGKSKSTGGPGKSSFFMSLISPPSSKRAGSKPAIVFSKAYIRIIRLCYKLLLSIVESNQRVSNLVASANFDLYSDHVDVGMSIRGGLNAAEFVENLVDNNLSLLHSLSRSTIDHFVELLRNSKRNTRYLRLIKACCSCNGVAVHKNQMFVVESLLRKNFSLLIETKFVNGKVEIDIGDTANNVQKWLPLERFSDPKGEYYADNDDGVDLGYFVEQLDLFHHLALGNNESAIKFITQPRDGVDAFLDPNEVFTCLFNDKLPPLLRAKYAEILPLFQGWFVPAQEALGVKQTWLWNECSSNHVAKFLSFESESADGDSSGKGSASPLPVGKLKEKLFAFLSDNQSQQMDKLELNALIESVLNLVRLMILNGVYEDPKEQQKLYSVLLGGLDARNDNFSSSALPEQRRSLALVKVQICEIFTLFFELYVEQRLSLLLESFRKHVDASGGGAAATMPPVDIPSSADLLRPYYQLTNEGTKNALTEVLLDLLKIESAPLQTAALSLLTLHRRALAETVDQLGKCQLLKNGDEMYHQAARAIRNLGALLADETIEEDEAEAAVEAIGELTRLCIRKSSMAAALTSPLPTSKSKRRKGVSKAKTALNDLQFAATKPDLTGQTILLNLKANRYIFHLLHTAIGDKPPAHIVQVFKAAHQFLCYFFRANPETQEACAHELPLLMRQIELGIDGADESLAELIRNNHSLLQHGEVGMEELDEFCVQQLRRRGKRESRLLRLLSATTSANGQPIQVNQIHAIEKLSEHLELVLPARLASMRKALTERAAAEAAAAAAAEEAESLAAPATTLESGGKSKISRAKSSRRGKEEVQIAPQIASPASQEALAEASAAIESGNEDPEYEAAFVRLLADTAQDKNNTAEILGQSILSFDLCTELLASLSMTDKAKASSSSQWSLRAALLTFLSECWFFTENDLLALNNDPRTWAVIQRMGKEVKQFHEQPKLLAEDVDAQHYLYESMLPFIHTFFVFQQGLDFRGRRGECAHTLLDELCMLALSMNKERDSSKQVRKLIAAIQALSDAGPAKSFKTTSEGRPISDIVAAVGKLGMSRAGSTLQQRARQMDQLESQIKLESWSRSLKETLDCEAELRRLALLVSRETTGLSASSPIASHVVSANSSKEAAAALKDPGLSIAGPLAAVGSGGGGNLGIRRPGQSWRRKKSDFLYLEKLVKKLSDRSLFRANLDEVELAKRRKMIQSILVVLQHALLPRSDALVSGLEDAELPATRRVQTQLCRYGALNSTLELFDATDDEILLNAIKLGAALCIGGNEIVQQQFVRYFHSSSDPHFFTRTMKMLTHVRQKLKRERAKQKGASNRARRGGDASAAGDAGGGPGSEEDFDAELERLRRARRQLLSNSRDFDLESCNNTLIFLKEMCEGHFVPLQDYLRHQEDNSKSFDLVKEVAAFGAGLERYVVFNGARGQLVNGSLFNQCMRTLTELVQGNESNGEVVGTSKLMSSLSKFLRRQTLSAKAHPALHRNRVNVTIHLSVLELLNALVDGLDPSKSDSSTAFLPKLLLRQGLSEDLLIILRNLHEQRFPRHEAHMLSDDDDDGLRSRHKSSMEMSIMRGLSLAQTMDDADDLEAGDASAAAGQSHVDRVQISEDDEYYDEIDTIIQQITILTKILQPFEIDLGLPKSLLGHQFPLTPPLAVAADDDEDDAEDGRDGGDGENAAPGAAAEAAAATTLQKEPPATAHAIISFLGTHFEDVYSTIAQVEVNTELGVLTRLLFVKPRKLDSYLTGDVRDDFNKHVNRSSAADKAHDLLDQLPYLLRSIDLQRRRAQSPLRFLLHERSMRVILMILTLALNVVMVVFLRTPPPASLYEGSDMMSAGNLLPAEENPCLGGDTVCFSVPEVLWPFRIIGIAHAAISLLATLAFFWRRGALILIKKLLALTSSSTGSGVSATRSIKDELGEEASSANAAPLVQGDVGSVSLLRKTSALLFDGRMIYYTLFPVMSVLGIFWPYLYAYHLFEIVAHFSDLQTVVEAVTARLSLLLLTTFFGMMFFEVFAIVMYLFLRPEFENASMMCNSVLECFLTSLYGIIAGGATVDNLDPPAPGSFPSITDVGNSTYFAGRYIFVLLFFVVIFVLILNIILAALLDTFAALRERDDEIRDKKASECFICSIESNEFARRGIAFEKHISHSHNMWDYVFLISYLMDKPRSEFTSTESSVAQRIAQKDISFLPIGKSLEIPETTKD